MLNAIRLFSNNNPHKWPLAPYAIITSHNVRQSSGSTIVDYSFESGALL